MCTPRTGHDPARKIDWDCLACGRPWPCDPAREDLLTTHDAVQLRIAMWDALEEAARILPHTPAAELFERFLHWTEPAAG
ncbi:hypothetical protein FHR83_004693 [Actinoplanes campanulatus]|uniref:Flavin reductase n=1 Tax=Actinoplanes campanulatus TaxID=113559 RepID=A0A7W5AIP8_9ACTN|nr:hypothetical protein [Actinoplanes campanulatus]MBB3097018.1 hypothetical protein [Actinoplanes campanulatus]GGN15074.1 hypothetical protein GCM10010109_26770 [Actinoplanes campanulatus]GID37800.1 hypothetical protein Aca09nite_43060 [Actinoplanes campanulatus]